MLDIIPDSAIGAFAKGDILQVLLFSLLFGFALLGARRDGARACAQFVDDAGHAMFGVIAIVMKAAPIGAFGAMAYTVGKYGSAALLSLAGLIGAFYLTSALFVVVVLGDDRGGGRFQHFPLISPICSDELLIVLGTSSSESALPALMEKLERLGCSKSVVGLVVPTGYSFNLDGTNIYMTLTTLFIARAMGVGAGLSASQATILVVAMLTSKGASGVSGAGFITLARDARPPSIRAGAGHVLRARHRQIHERMPGARPISSAMASRPSSSRRGRASSTARSCARGCRAGSSPSECETAVSTA